MHPSKASVACGFKGMYLIEQKNTKWQDRTADLRITCALPTELTSLLKLLGSFNDYVWEALFSQRGGFTTNRLVKPSLQLNIHLPSTVDSMLFRAFYCHPCWIHSMTTSIWSSFRNSGTLVVVGAEFGDPERRCNYLNTRLMLEACLWMSVHPWNGAHSSLIRNGWQESWPGIYS